MFHFIQTPSMLQFISRNPNYFKKSKLFQEIQIIFKISKGFTRKFWKKFHLDGWDAPR